MISLAIDTLASVSRLTAAPRTGRHPYLGAKEAQIRDESRPGTIPRAGSSVDVPEDRVDAGDDGHRVGDEPAAHHVGQGLDVDERRGPHVQPVRARPAVAGDVAPELAARALDGHVHLALGDLEPLGEDLE